MNQLKNIFKSASSMKGNVPLIVLVFALLAIGGFAFYQYYYSTEKVILRASEKFDKVKTLHTDLSMNMKIKAPNPNGGTTDQEGTFKGEVDSDIENDSAKMNMSVSMMGISADVDAVVLKGEDIYFKIPFLTQTLALQGKNIEWISMNLDEIYEMYGIEKPSDDPNEDFDVEKLKESININSTKKLNDETIGEHKTTKYQVEIDLDKFVKSIKNDQVKDMYEGALDKSTIDAYIWIDKMQDKIIKVEANIKDINFTAMVNSSNSANESVYGDITFEATFSKFNEPVDIKKPEGSITDYKDLQNMSY